jgi:hypothetical protein
MRHRHHAALPPHLCRNESAPQLHRAAQCHGLLLIFCVGVRMWGTQYVFYVFPGRIFWRDEFFFET